MNEDNLSKIKKEILKFDQFKKIKNHKRYNFFSDIPYVLKVFPKKISNIAMSKGLCVSGLVHGDEVNSIMIINNFIEKIITDKFIFDTPLTFCLGNVEAARKGKRFIHADLNRSFCRSKNETVEDKRARELELSIQDCKFHIDFHQTVGPTESEFALFKYFENHHRFLRSIDNSIPLVTFQRETFSKDGSGFPEYLRKLNGIAITFELGEKGFCQKQTFRGVEIIEKSIRSIEEEKTNSEILKDSFLYTWEEIIKKEGDFFELRPGFKNFGLIKKGQMIAKSKSKFIYAKKDGVILFPKYGALLSSSSEACRVLKKISLVEVKK